MASDVQALNSGDEAGGDYVALVVRVEPAANGEWYLYVNGTQDARVMPLRPLTLVIRVWRRSGAFRGQVQLRGHDTWAPFQSNAQLEELVRHWLSGGGVSAASH